jgi:hypothetical protein
MRYDYVRLYHFFHPYAVYAVYEDWLAAAAFACFLRSSIFRSSAATISVAMLVRFLSLIGEWASLTHPLIFARISLMMHSLLNHPLVLWILGIQYLDRLPPPLLLPRIIRLHCQTSKQHTQRQSLRIHTRLHQFLRACQVRVAMDEAECDAHRCDP